VFLPTTLPRHKAHRARGAEPSEHLDKVFRKLNVKSRTQQRDHDRESVANVSVEWCEITNVARDLALVF